MKRLTNLLKNCAFGVPGAILGLVYAHVSVQQATAAQLARRGWVDSTGLDSLYFAYGCVGYVLSVLAIAGAMAIYRRRARHA
jgi:hypothetical protein